MMSATLVVKFIRAWINLIPFCFHYLIRVAGIGAYGLTNMDTANKNSISNEFIRFGAL